MIGQRDNYSCLLRIAVIGISLMATAIGSAQVTPTDLPDPSGRSEVQIEAERRLWGQFPEVADCDACHASNRSGGLLKSEAHAFPRMNELAVWLQNDRHAIARLAVEPIRSKSDSTQESDYAASQNLSYQICTNLGWNVHVEDGYQKFASQCLSCHAGKRSPGENETTSKPKDNLKQPGISCSYCHQVGAIEDWVAYHPNRRRWSTKSHAEKSAAGLRNLTSISERTSLCLDCHLGNLPQGQFVSHAMYVAGHPPLRAFELGAFSEAMPRHWMDPLETLVAVGETEFASKYASVQFPELFESKPSLQAIRTIPWETRASLLASLVSLKRSIELFKDAPDQGLLGDYALFDCTGCHHSLRLPSPRQEQGYAGTPGRPRLPVWQWPLASVAAEIGEQSSQGSGRIAGASGKTRPFIQDLRVHRLLDEQPFGNSEGSSDVVAEDVASLEKLVKVLEAAWLGPEHLQEVVVGVASLPAPMYGDYLSAQQILWCLQAVGRDQGHAPGDKAHVVIDILSQTQALHRELGINSSQPIPTRKQDLLLRANYSPSGFVPLLKGILDSERQGH